MLKIFAYLNLSKGYQQTTKVATSKERVKSRVRGGGGVPLRHVTLATFDKGVRALRGYFGPL